MDNQVNQFEPIKVIHSDDCIKILWTESIKPKKIYLGWEPDFSVESGIEIEQTFRNNFIEIDDKKRIERPYFIIVTETDEMIRVAEREIKLKGVANFRDLGGYRGFEGKRVKWGKLYRSASLHGLEEEDISCLKRMGLKTIVDYRGIEEVGKQPDPIIEGICYHNIRPVDEAGAANPYEYIFSGKDLNADKILIDLNRQFVKDEYSLNAYRRMVDLSKEIHSLPIVQHCTAGKDRVGLGSATLLLALGVPVETVIYDYLLSNDYRKEINERDLALLQSKGLDQQHLEAFKLFTQVKQTYIEAMLDQMIQTHGSTDQYLVKGLGLTPVELADMRGLLLE